MAKAVARNSTQFMTLFGSASQYGLRTAVAMALATLLATNFHMLAPYWAAISVIAIMNPYIGATYKKGIYRIIGTIMGAIIGLILANYSANNVIVLLFCAFAILFIGQYFTQTSKYAYAFLLGSVAALMVTVSIITGPRIGKSQTRNKSTRGRPG